LNRISVNKNFEDPTLQGRAFCVEGDNGKVIGCKSVFVHGPCKSFYEVDERYGDWKIVFIKTDFSVDKIQEKIEHTTMKNLVFIDRDIILSNNKDNKNNPVCKVIVNDSVRYCMQVIIHGPSRMLYDPTLPENRIWIETDSDIEMIGEQIDYIP